MFYIDAIRAYHTDNTEEIQQKEIMLEFIEKNKEDVLLRTNRIAHMTSSSMIFNHRMDKVLMVYHNIYNSWAWTGGHADGETDLLYTARKEAAEETGVNDLELITQEILSLDVLHVEPHYKRGNYVAAHLHFSACYGFIADESSKLCVKPDENSGVAWLPFNRLDEYVTEPVMIPIYEKIIRRAKSIARPLT